MFREEISSGISLELPLGLEEGANIRDLPEGKGDEDGGLEDGPEEDLSVDALEDALVDVLTLVHVRLVVLEQVEALLQVDELALKPDLLVVLLVNLDYTVVKGD